MVRIHDDQDDTMRRSWPKEYSLYTAQWHDRHIQGNWNGDVNLSRRLSCETEGNYQFDCLKIGKQHPRIARLIQTSLILS